MNRVAYIGIIQARTNSNQMMWEEKILLIDGLA